MGAANQTTVTLVPLHGISSVVSFRISRRCMVEFSSSPRMKARQCGTTCASDGGDASRAGRHGQPQRNEVKVANFDCLFLMKKQVAQADEDEGIDFTDVREVTDFSQAKRLSEYGTVADALLQALFSPVRWGLFTNREFSKGDRRHLLHLIAHPGRGRVLGLEISFEQFAEILCLARKHKCHGLPHFEKFPDSLEDPAEWADGCCQCGVPVGFKSNKPLIIADLIERGFDMSASKREGSDRSVQASRRPNEVGVENRDHGIGKHTHTTIISAGVRR